MISRLCCAAWAALSVWGALTAADLAGLAASRGAGELAGVFGGFAGVNGLAAVACALSAVAPRRGAVR
jgi:hypothetical protein